MHIKCMAQYTTQKDYSNITFTSVSQTTVLCAKLVLKEKKMEGSIRISVISEVDHHMRNVNLNG